MTRDIAAELAAVLEAAGLGLARPPAPGANLFTSPMPEVDGGVPDSTVALVGNRPASDVAGGIAGVAVVVDPDRNVEAG